jgi:4-amino-4-deoxy-L-arabinose transferase-like glycosyltransferase
MFWNSIKRGGYGDSSSSPTTPAYLVLAMLSLFILFHDLGKPVLFDPDEGRNAEVAREILLRKDWVTPHYDFIPYLDKPIFLFWLIAVSFKIFGVSEWSARLPSILAALGCLWDNSWLQVGAYP